MRTLIVPSKKSEKRIARFYKKHPELRIPTERVLSVLLQDPLSQKVGAHKLSGVLKLFWGADVTPKQYRIVYAFDEHHLYFINIGTHNEVY